MFCLKAMFPVRQKPLQSNVPCQNDKRKPFNSVQGHIGPRHYVPSSGHAIT
jgi:hypothetical protein